MYWILFVMGALVAIVVALVVGGLATPRAHVVSRTVVLRASIDAVWAIIRDVQRYPEWRHELTDVTLTSGERGEEWTEQADHRAVRFGVTTDDPPRTFAARILDEDLPYSGDWRWELAPANGVQGGTRVTITERGEIGNPIFRFIGTHFIGHTKSIDRYLGALAAKLGEPGARERGS